MIKYKSNEWYKARIGKFTASNFAYLMAKPADNTAIWSKSALNYIEKAALQLYLNEYHERPDSDSTRWGIKYEHQAIQEFGQKTGFEIEEAGFELHPEIPDIGATPDAIIIEKGDINTLILAQIKCPYNSRNHLDYIKKIHDGFSLKKSKSAYYWQIQGEIWITGAAHNYFVTFDPRFNGENRLHYVKVEKDEEAICLLHNTIIKAIDLRNVIVNEFETGKRQVKSLINYW